MRRAGLPLTSACAVLTDEEDIKRKQPFFIHKKDDRRFAFAGLWERWKREHQEIESCSIIVTDANDVLNRDRADVRAPGRVSESAFATQ
ncbi:MAG TPA: SOS response-associated peptidase family protein, partial [Planctomycetaceae bacterium]|nr:SOS response-associated peptidase family protein [Planctomycetaceae bacterium]